VGETGREGVGERATEVGNLLLRLGEDPESLEGLARAFDEGDATAFREILFRNLDGIELPPDKCDPYVRVAILVTKEPKVVRKCEWVGRILDSIEGEQLSKAVVNGISSEHLTDLLVKLGLVKCYWVVEHQSDPAIINKFVQGVCPPGTF
jgi:hypothetical protein